MSRYSGEQILIVNQIQRIQPLDMPNDKLFAFAGRLRKNYGYDITLKILTKLKEGSSISYIVGACKKEFLKLKSMGIKQ